jgi:hypothetical protein
MKTVIIDYEKISPAVLASIVERKYADALCNWSDINEDSFEFRVYGVADIKGLEDVLAKYV